MSHIIGKSFGRKREDVGEMTGISPIGDPLVVWWSCCHIGEAPVKIFNVFPAKCDNAEIMLLPTAVRQMFESRFVVGNVSDLQVNGYLPGRGSAPYEGLVGIVYLGDKALSWSPLPPKLVCPWCLPASHFWLHVDV